MPSYDVLVIGAGYIGCSVSYYLAKAGLRTALIDQSGIGAGASTANYGNIQVQDAELDHSLPMIQAGFACFETLEEELKQSVGLRKLGSLLLIETEAQWQTMAARLPYLHAAGIQAELVETTHLRELEPLLNPLSALGACYYEHEGQVNPFALTRAYIHQAQNYGLATHLGTKVTSFATRSDRIQSVITTDGEFSAASVILCTGAWTPLIGRMLERDWDISHVHGQALVTEAAPQLRLRNHLASAAFFEAAHDEEGNLTAESAILAISQTAGGHFLLGEAAKNTEDLGSASTAAGQAAIADLSAAYFPSLLGLNTLRGWAAPVAFTHDSLPFLGPVDGIDGLILATAFKSTVIVTPLVGQVIANLVVDGYATIDISSFSPDR